MSDTKISIVILIAMMLTAVTLAFMYFEDRYGDDKQPIQSLTIPSSIMEIIDSKYTGIDHEFAVCLYGDVVGNDATVNGYYFAEIVDATDMKLLAKSCKRYIDMESESLLAEMYHTAKDKFSLEPTLLGSIHSHPNELCALSEEDIYSYGYSRYQLTGIICGTSKIRAYTEDNLKEGFEVTIY